MGKTTAILRTSQGSGTGTEAEGFIWLKPSRHCCQGSKSSEEARAAESVDDAACGWVGLDAHIGDVALQSVRARPFKPAASYHRVYSERIAKFLSVQTWNDLNA